MKAHVLTGSKSEMVESVARIKGRIHEIIVFVEEPTDSAPKAFFDDDIFAEMEPFTVRVGNADCSRELIYTRLDGE